MLHAVCRASTEEPPHRPLGELMPGQALHRALAPTGAGHAHTPAAAPAAPPAAAAAVDEATAADGAASTARASSARTSRRYSMDEPKPRCPCGLPRRGSHTSFSGPPSAAPDPDVAAAMASSLPFEGRAPTQTLGSAAPPMLEGGTSPNAKVDAARQVILLPHLSSASLVCISHAIAQWLLHATVHAR